MPRRLLELVTSMADPDCSSLILLPRQGEVGASWYWPPTEWGARGRGAPGSGGSRLSCALTRDSPSEPPITPPTTWASIWATRPRTQCTAPFRRPFLKVNAPLSVDCALEIVTKRPDCSSSTFGPRQESALDTS